MSKLRLALLPTPRWPPFSAAAGWALFLLFSTRGGRLNLRQCSPADPLVLPTLAP